MAEATHFKFKNQATRLWGCIRSDATGDLLTGGLGTLAGTVTVDGATNVSTTTPVEAPANSGWFYVDVTADQMNGDFIGLRVTASAANAMDFTEGYYTLSNAELTGNFWASSVKRFEQMIYQFFGYACGKTEQSNQTGAITAYKNDGSTVVGTRTWSNTGNAVRVDKLS